VKILSYKPARFQLWLTKNRLWLWWAIYIPLVVLIIIFNWEQLNLPSNDLSNLGISPQYKIFNSVLIIVLARVTLVAIGVVLIMICLFFPFFRVSRGGVQWTKEFEEELAEVSGEIAGEEIGGLVKEESFRWSLVYGWLKLGERELLEPQFLLRELLATIWEAFPNQRISLSFINDGQSWGIFHPLLSKLVVAENMNMLEDETTFGLNLRFLKGIQLLLHVYSDPEGFSQIDEKFILILGEIFLLTVMKQGYAPEELLTYFDRVPLTFTNIKV
jgi:hypothetical protein